MNNNVFGEVQFNMGWEKKEDINLFNQTYTVTVSAAAYFDTDKITDEQEKAYGEFEKEKINILTNVEHLMEKIKDGEKRYAPSLLLFQRNGDYALLFDDVNDNEDGIAVTIRPEYSVINTDQYL